MKVNIKKLDKSAKLPIYGSKGAACFDLHSLQENYLLPGIIAKLYTGLAFEVPNNHVMLLFGRSGHASKGIQLANCVGVIDSDYRGELIVMLRNDTQRNVIIREGERCAQAMIIPTFNTTFTEVDDITETNRGSGGFGSTGK